MVDPPVAATEAQLGSYLTHELRAPLTSVRSALGLLAMNLEGRLTPDEAETLRLAARNAERLGGLEPLAEIVELFDRLRPVYCVVPTSLLDVFCNEVVWACEAENVACVLLQSGWDNMSSKGLLSRRTPFAGVWGPQSLEHAVAIQRLASKRLATLGAPHYEFLRPAAPDDVQRQIGRAHV